MDTEYNIVLIQKRIRDSWHVAKLRKQTQRKLIMAHSVAGSNLSCIENKLVSSAPKCRKLTLDLRKRFYFKKSPENIINLACLVPCFFLGIASFRFADYIATKYNSEDAFVWLPIAFFVVITIAIYQIANFVVLAGKPAWIAVMRKAMLEEYSQMIPSDAWYVGESAKYVKTWATDLTAHEVKAIKRILELEEESIRMGKIKNAEEELLDQCRDALTCSTTYRAITGRCEDTTDLRHVLITQIAELEEKLKVKK